MFMSYVLCLFNNFLLDFREFAKFLRHLCAGSFRSFVDFSK